MPSPSTPQTTAASVASMTELAAPDSAVDDESALAKLSNVRFSNVSGTPGARSSDCVSSARSGSNVMASTIVHIAIPNGVRARPSGSGWAGEDETSSSQPRRPIVAFSSSAPTARTSRTTPMVATTASGSSTIPDCRYR